MEERNLKAPLRREVVISILTEDHILIDHNGDDDDADDDDSDIV